MPDTTEKRFEMDIADFLLSPAGGYTGNHDVYDPRLGLFPATLCRFVQKTQPKEWARFVMQNQTEPERKFCLAFNNACDAEGLLSVLRHGFKHRGVSFRVCYFRPESGLNQTAAALYAKNEITCSRQWFYSAENHNSVDMVLAVNGIPVFAFELKNQYTGQNVEHARNQWIIMPTVAMREADADFAVSFACPNDAEGLYMIYGRQSCDTRKLEADCPIDVGNQKYGGQEALVVFDDVFIPNEYVFMAGEYEFAGMMVERFAGYHRQSYGGCKVGVGDVVIGAAALAAEYNGAEKASHIKDKLIEMTHLNETLFSCGIACSAEGFQTKAGNYQIDLLLANVCKQNITRFPYEIVRLAEDIAGGLMVTLPSQKDFESSFVVGRNGESIGDVCQKYFKTKDDVSTEDRNRVLRLLENLCLGAAAVGYRTESMHGAGSPQAQRIMISRQGNIQGKKQLAKDIAGIKE